MLALGTARIIRTFLLSILIEKKKRFLYLHDCHKLEIG